MNAGLVIAAVAAALLFAVGIAFAIRGFLDLHHVGRHRAPRRPTRDDDPFAAMVAAEPELAAALRDAWQVGAEEEPS